MLDTIKAVCKNGCAILKGFDRSDVAVEIKGTKPVLETALCSVWLNPFISFRQIEQINRAAPNRAFSIAALRAHKAETILARINVVALLTSRAGRIAGARESINRQQGYISV